MMHTIRLRRPWEKTRIGSEQISRIDVPETIVPSESAKSTFRYVRRFNSPTGLDDQSSVHLRIDRWSGQLEFVSLNGQPLEIGADSVDVEVTHLLKGQNQIDVQLIDTADSPASLCGEVTLVIFETG